MKMSLKNQSWSTYALLFMFVLGVLAPILASQDGFWGIPSPIPYGENQMDLMHANAVSPFEKQANESIYYRHWLGTDELGRDVLSQLIHGSNTAFTIGFIAMFIAALVGIIIGGLAGYLGDYSLKIGRSRIIVGSLLFLSYLIMIISMIPWDINAVSFSQKVIQLTITTILFLGLGLWINTYLKKREISKKSKRRTIPVDILLSRLIEIMDSLPLFFIIVAFSALFTPNQFWLSVIIGLNAWPTIAKYFRAEVLKVKRLAFVEGAQSMGFQQWRILLKHILPNAISPVLVSLCFGVASAILIESSLSFLGLGTPSEHASWGKLLAEARSNYHAWWLSIFPGLCIFITVYGLNKLADSFTKS